jgi:osmotically-inducible protein OsmY
MKTKNLIVASMVAVSSLIGLQGCAVARGQSTVGEYVDDATVTSKVKAKFIEAKSVDASSISVQTLNGEVLLSGFAKSATEKSEAERIAQTVKGAKHIKNEIVVRE